MIGRSGIKALQKNIYKRQTLFLHAIEIVNFEQKNVEQACFEYTQPI